MKKTAKRTPPETSLDRYDWSRATRGRFAGKLRKGHVVAIDDDVWASFPDEKLINKALRLLAAAAVAAVPKKGRARRAKAA